MTRLRIRITFLKQAHQFRVFGYASNMATSMATLDKRAQSRLPDSKASKKAMPNIDTHNTQSQAYRVAIAAVCRRIERELGVKEGSSSSAKRPAVATMARPQPLLTPELLRQAKHDQREAPIVSALMRALSVFCQRWAEERQCASAETILNVELALRGVPYGQDVVGALWAMDDGDARIPRTDALKHVQCETDIGAERNATDIGNGTERNATDIGAETNATDIGNVSTSLSSRRLLLAVVHVLAQTKVLQVRSANVSKVSGANSHVEAVETSIDSPLSILARLLLREWRTHARLQHQLATMTHSSEYPYVNGSALPTFEELELRLQCCTMFHGRSSSNCAETIDADEMQRARQRRDSFVHSTVEDLNRNVEDDEKRTALAQHITLFFRWMVSVQAEEDASGADNVLPNDDVQSLRERLELLYIKRRNSSHLPLIPLFLPRRLLSQRVLKSTRYRIEYVGKKQEFQTRRT